MRIAQLANFVGPASGGMKTALEALGRGYVAAGAERLLVVPGPKDAVSETEHGRVVQLRAPRIGDGYRLVVEPWRVAAVLEEFDPHSLEISDKSTMLPLARWAQRRGTSAVLFSHEHLGSMVRHRTGWEWGVEAGVQAWYRQLAARFDRVVVTSAFAASEFATTQVALGDRLRRVALGVDLDTFHPNAVHLRASNRPLRLVHFGRLSPEKTPMLAVETAVELHRRGVAVQLDVYGEGPQRAALETLAAGAPVTFHGHVGSRTALARAVASADVALSPCPVETFGLAVLEALASGTPVVTADRGGARELVDGSCGAWGAPDAGALADAVLSLTDRHGPELRDAARRHAATYTWHRTTQQMMSVHAEAIQARASLENRLEVCL